MAKEEIREINIEGVNYVAYIFTCNNGKEIPAIGITLQSCKRQVTTILKLKK